jgi:deoxyribonuclease V
MKFPENKEEALKIQRNLSKKIKIIPYKKHSGYVAGVDASFFESSVIGVACIFKYPEMNLIEEAYAVTESTFPYIPGFLSFREGPAIIKAIKMLKIKPDIILFDGQGIAHPYSMGIATHIGILLNMPSIGCAKSRLVGSYKEPSIEKGSYSYLKYRDNIIGAVLRTRTNVSPLYISPGHRITLKDAIKIVLKCTTTYRIPEPLRRADSLSKIIKNSCVETA